jgi:hypothetical protein
MELTNETARRLLNDMLSGITGKLLSGSELFVDITTAQEFVDYLFPFIITKMKSLWEQHQSNQPTVHSLQEQIIQKNIVAKRILMICLLSGATMETSALVLAEITA